MMVVFSQYLKNVPVPVPVYTPKGGFRVVRAPVFKLFPVRKARRHLVKYTELIGSLKLGNVWFFVRLIFGPHWPMNQLNQNLNIA